MFFKRNLIKNIQLGTLVEAGDQELKEIKGSTHHFCYLSKVMSGTCTSTTARLINNTKTSVPGKLLKQYISK